jgi:hypothetical protein
MPPASKVEVRLTDDQRAALGRLLRTGTHPAAMRRRAAILLKADADGPDAWTDDEIADHLDTSRMTAMRVRMQFAADGSTPPCTASGRPAGSTASSTGGRKPGWSRWPAPRPPRAMPGGR